jgi:hypothetical protein
MLPGINAKKTLASTQNIVFNKALQTKPQPYGATFKGEIEMKKTPKAKPLTALEKAERKASIAESALYQAYNDQDEVFGLLYLIINEAESPEPNKYQLRRALQGLRTLLIANQCNMMDYAGLEY